MSRSKKLECGCTAEYTPEPKDGSVTVRIIRTKEGCTQRKVLLLDKAGMDVAARRIAKAKASGAFL